MSEYVVRVTGLVPDAIYESAVEEIVRCKDCKRWAADDCEWNRFFNDPEIDEPDGFRRTIRAADSVYRRGARILPVD